MTAGRAHSIIRFGRSVAAPAATIVCLVVMSFWAGRASRDRDVFGREVIVAARRGEFTLCQGYLQRGGDPDLSDRTGFTLAFFAVSYGNHELLNELIANGADVRVVPKGFEDLMLEAIAHQDIRSVGMLIKSGQWDGSAPDLIRHYIERARLHSEQFGDEVEASFRETLSENAMTLVETR